MIIDVLLQIYRILRFIVAVLGIILTLLGELIVDAVKKLFGDKS